MNGSHVPPASALNEITWSCYVALDWLIFSPVLVGGPSDPFMLPPCTYLQVSETSTKRPYSRVSEAAIGQDQFVRDTHVHKRSQEEKLEIKIRLILVIT
jgi:hypothetical protein